MKERHNGMAATLIAWRSRASKRTITLAVVLVLASALDSAALYEQAWPLQPTVLGRILLILAYTLAAADSLALRELARHAAESRRGRRSRLGAIEASRLPGSSTRSDQAGNWHAAGKAANSDYANSD